MAGWPNRQGMERFVKKSMNVLITDDAGHLRRALSRGTIQNSSCGHPKADWIEFGNLRCNDFALGWFKDSV